MTSLSTRDLFVRALRACGAIAAIYPFLYYLLSATTGLHLVALLNLTLASASAMLMMRRVCPTRSREERHERRPSVG